MKVVLDTNVLLSGLMYPGGTPGRIVAAWRRAEFDLVMTREQLAEIARVLSYPKIARVLCWDRETIERFLKQIYLRSSMVELPAEHGIAVPADPDDTPILASLVASGAECLVTGDADMLALKDHYPIMTPGEFATRLT